MCRLMGNVDIHTYYVLVYCIMAYRDDTGIAIRASFPSSLEKCHYSWAIHDSAACRQNACLEPGRSAAELNSGEDERSCKVDTA